MAYDLYLAVKHSGANIDGLDHLNKFLATRDEHLENSLSVVAEETNMKDVLSQVIELHGSESVASVDVIDDDKQFKALMVLEDGTHIDVEEGTEPTY